MTLISIKARPGRTAFTKPKDGRRIPEDAFITVPLTPWIRSLIERHGDIEFRQPADQPTAVSTEYPDDAQADPPAKAKRKGRTAIPDASPLADQ